MVTLARSGTNADALRHFNDHVAGAMNLAPGLARVDAPTLVITGAADPMGAAAADELMEALPNGTLAVVPGDHFPFWNVNTARSGRGRCSSSSRDKGSYATWTPARMRARSDGTRWIARSAPARMRRCASRLAFGWNGLVTVRPSATDMAAAGRPSTSPIRTGPRRSRSATPSISVAGRIVYVVAENMPVTLRRRGAAGHGASRHRDGGEPTPSSWAA
jgi:hypothetical protein